MLQLTMGRCVYYKMFSLKNNRTTRNTSYLQYHAMNICAADAYDDDVVRPVLSWMLPGCDNPVCLQLNTYIIFYRSWTKSNHYKGALFVTLFDIISALQAFLWILLVLCLCLLTHLPFLLQTPSGFFHLHQSGSTNANQLRVFLSRSSDRNNYLN